MPKYRQPFRSFFSALFLPILAFSSLSFGSKSPWRITQVRWTEYHEEQYGAFVATIGAAVEKRQCGSLSTCMKSTANFYFGSDPKELSFYADCADLPYYLRAYFAWKNGLPFSFVSEVAARPGTEGENTSDLRYSRRGNYVVKRIRIETGDDAINILNSYIPGHISSASFRMSGVEEGPMLSDFYPTNINRESIRPGTIIYDPNGHVATVYKVTPEGRVFYIDAHPDNSITSGMFTSKFARSIPDHGAGFKNFRPLTLVGAHDNGDGVYIGGQIVATPNDQIPNFGIEQFYGTNGNSSNWKKASFTINGKTLDFLEYVRIKLTLGTKNLNPLSDFKLLTNDICSSLKDRITAVNEASASSIDREPHPFRLPTNIYGTDGSWEAYATPSRDARLKVSFVDLLNQAKSLIKRFQSQDPTLAYYGENLAVDLYRVYITEAKNCQFSYKTSDGKRVLLDLESARQRLFDMSFDPYHCIELRWGARSRSELSSCKDDANKREWYLHEQWLRNQIDRTYEARMDYSLSELDGPKPGAGVLSPPDTDIVSYLKSQR